jgi:sentrin-specific protease 7
MHVFSSFFYTRLITELGHEHPATLNAAQRHGRVKEWTQNVNIFDKDFVLVPINENSHWYLIVICFPGMHGSDSVPDSELVTSESNCQFIFQVI